MESVSKMLCIGVFVYNIVMVSEHSKWLVPYRRNWYCTLQGYWTFL